MLAPTDGENDMKFQPRIQTTSAEIKAALGKVRVRKLPNTWRVCTLDGSPIQPYLAKAEALGFRCYPNQSHEVFLHG